MSYDLHCAYIETNPGEVTPYRYREYLDLLEYLTRLRQKGNRALVTRVTTLPLWAGGGTSQNA